MKQNTEVSDEGIGKTSSDFMTLSGAGSLSSSTDIPLRRIVAMPASVMVIPRLPEGRMGRWVSPYFLSLNLSNPSSGGSTAEAM